MPEGAERSDLAEGLLQGSQQKWKQFRKEVMCCLRTSSQPQCQGCGRPVARPGCGSGHRGRPPALLLSPRAGAGLVLMLGRFPSRDRSAWMNGSLQSLWCRASGGTLLPGAPRPQGDARQACAHALCVAQRVPAWGGPTPLPSLAVPDANCQQTHMGTGGTGPPARALVSPTLPSGWVQLCPCCSFPARQGAGAGEVLCDQGTPGPRGGQGAE